MPTPGRRGLHKRAGHDAAEREAVLARKRLEYEKALQLNRLDLRQYMRYAQLEIDAGNISQARSIFERALSVDYTYVPLWHRYAETEAKARFYDNAEVVLNRATQLLPLEQKLWLSRLEFAELRGDTRKCREIFDQWRATGSADVWRPWYIFEKRHAIEPAATVNFLRQWAEQCPHDVKSWITLAANVPKSQVRDVYASALASKSLDESDTQHIRRLIDETGTQEAEEGQSAQPLKKSTAPVDIDHLVQTAATSLGGDIELWWSTINEYVDLATSDQLTLLETATSKCLPHESGHKTTQWRTYALLWIRYAFLLELASEQNSDEVSALYEKALSHWDHSRFTSTTLWRNYAHFYLRQGDIMKCRKVFGSALGKTRQNPVANLKILRDYISLEKQLLEDERVRRLYIQLCSNGAQSSLSWVEFAEFEASLEETERADFLFQSALKLRGRLDDPDRVWKAWAECVADHDLNKSRIIWEDAVKNCENPADMFTHYAIFEVGTGLGDESDTPDEAAVARARAVFHHGLRTLVGNEEHYATLVAMYRQFEDSYGSEEAANEILGELNDTEPQPGMVDDDDDGPDEPAPDNEGRDSSDSSSDESEAGDDSEPAPQLSAVERLLANARKWKETQEA